MAKRKKPTTDHQYGDAPAEIEYLEKMRVIAKALDEVFNGSTMPVRQIGFIVLVFPYGEKEGRCNYISNGARREDVLKLLQEQAKRFEETINGVQHE